MHSHQKASPDNAVSYLPSLVPSPLSGQSYPMGGHYGVYKTQLLLSLPLTLLLTLSEVRRGV